MSAINTEADVDAMVLDPADHFEAPMDVVKDSRLSRSGIRWRAAFAQPGATRCLSTSHTLPDLFILKKCAQMPVVISADPRPIISI